MRLIDGRRVAANILAAVKDTIRIQHLHPGLAVIIVGDDPASHLYVQLKERACADVGINFTKRSLAANASELDVLTHLALFNADPSVDGILVQLPLPPQLNEDRIIAAIDPSKDADGFHPETRQRFLAGDAAAMPPLVRAIDRLLTATGEQLAGKTAAVVSNSAVFAQPVIYQLKRLGISASHQLPDSSAQIPASPTADILITAIGQPGLVTGADIKSGSIIIDIGTTRLGEKIVGDVDAASVKNKVAWLTPVPGGVGPVTVATLLENVVELAQRKISL